MSELMQRLAELPPEKRQATERALVQQGEQFDIFPVSFAQRRLWFLDQLDPASAAYHLAAQLRLTGRLDQAALEHSLHELVARHEALRTSFLFLNGQPFQQIQPFDTVPLVLIDLSGLSAALQDAQVAAHAASFARQPFDLVGGQLLRALLLQLHADQHVLLLCFHHIAVDGWSLGVLVRELAALYNAARQGRTLDLPALPIQYVDYAVWQRQRLHGAQLEQLLAYWRHQLADVPPLVLPTDRPRPALPTAAGAQIPVTLAPDLVAGLEQVGQRTGATLFMTLLAAFQVLLMRYSGQTDIAVGTPIANRTRVETAPLVGYLANTLVLRADLSGEPTFEDALHQVRAVCLDAYEHQEVPFELLVEQLRPERSLSQNPLFQVLFVLQTVPPLKPDLAGLAVELVPLDTGTAKFDLTLDLHPTPDGGLSGLLEYAAELFDAASIARMVGHLQTLLRGIVADPRQAIADLPLLTPAERTQLLHDWNATAQPYAADQCIHMVFAAQAARTPNAVAVTHDDEQLTYAALEERVHQLARHLRALGVGPERRVGVCLRRSVDLVVALLGVLQAGGAYVPLDPNYPSERLQYMLEDSGATVLLTQCDTAAHHMLDASRAAVVLLDGDWPAAMHANEAPPAAAVDPANLAYVIYTSGSTGRPKGVALTHRNAAALIGWAGSVFPRDELANVLAATAISFDLSVFELFVTLCHGGMVVLADTVLDWSTAPSRQPVTLVNTVPSALIEALRLNALPESVQTVNLAGEPLPPLLVEQLYARPHIRRVYNLYGPSEDTTYSTYAVQDRAIAQLPTIGRPIGNTQAYVLDVRLEPVPIGVAGELYLAGDGLARGYLDRPGRTAEQFLPHPFSAEPGARMYRTGDLARFRANGQLDFLGRRDQQVKLRGFRIEPGEIETVLARHVAVREAAVIVREDAPGDRRLVAYVAAEAGSSPLTQELRATLRAKLPEYMLPSAFVVLPELPHTPNGKIDRRTLPAPVPQHLDNKEDGAAPAGPDEIALAGIWETVLGMPQIDRDANFFDLGGHSLLATQVIAQVRAVFAVELPLRSVFEHPTIAALSVQVAVGRHRSEELDAPPLRPKPRDGALPLSFAQQRLWLLAQLDPTSAAYHVPLIVHLTGPLDRAALERSLHELVARHETLRTTFALVDGQPVQRVHPPFAPPLPVVDLAALADDARDAQVAAHSEAIAREPFDMERGPLLRARLLRLDAEQHVLLLTLHHIAVDGWSLGVLVRDLAATYNAARRGNQADLPALPIQYADYAAWQRSWLQGAPLKRLLAYWQRQLAGVAPLVLPLDRPHPAEPTFHLAEQPLALPATLSAALVAFNAAAGTTMFMTLLAALDLLLHWYTRQDDILVGTDIANRTHAEAAGLIGFFVNMLALRTDLSSDPTFAQLLARVRTMCLEAYAHQDLPFELLVNQLQPERSLQRAPLFQVVLVLQNAPLPALELDQLSVQPQAVDAGVAKFDLVIDLIAGAQGMAGVFKYNTDVFDAATIARMAEQFVAVLELVVRQPDASLHTLVAQLSEADRQKQIHAARDLRAAQQQKRTMIRRKALSDEAR